MAKWILICANCQAEFKCSEINDVGMASFYLPLKPVLSPEGQKCVCPQCGYEGVYQRTDLLYRA